MDAATYQEESGATDERDYTAICRRMSDPEAAKLNHYVLGVGTEAGELQDAVKKHLIYGKPIDRVNIIEECGDVLWYIGRLLTVVDSTFEEAMARNNAKLKVRFGDKFTEHAALNRDLNAERATLSSKG